MADTKDEQVVETATGLGYVDLVEGTGTQPKTGDTVSVHYTGWLKSGTKFDSSVDRGTPFEFPVGKGRVIKGWDEGVISMKVGGKRKLIIPAHLGYGDRGAGGVIPGGDLIFEVSCWGFARSSLQSGGGGRHEAPARQAKTAKSMEPRLNTASEADQIMTTWSLSKVATGRPRCI
jgi:hypothetical protein